MPAPKQPALRDLVHDAGTGQMSGSKIWMHVAFAVATWVVIHHELSCALSDSMLTDYLLIVGGVAVASKGVSMGFTKSKPTQDAPE